jgi:adenosylcobinamide-GDP ribazoletransferase
LTIFSWPTRATTVPEEIGRSASFFSLVGFCLGLVLVLVNWLLDPYLASEIISVLLVTVLILMTRAHHLDGLRNSFDALWAKKGQEDAFAAMGEGRIQIFGLLAVLVVVALKFRTIEVMGDARSAGLLLAPALGHWAMVVLAYGSDAQGEGIEQTMVQQVRGFHLLLATAMALLLVIIFAGRLGLWIALWIALFALLSRSTLHRRRGGLTGDHLGGVEEISETLALVLFASL